MLIRRPKIMVYVTKQMLMTSLWYGKQYQSHQTYQNEEAGYAAFRQYLSQHKKATIEVVVDTVEEEYQLEVLPHVTASARREMLARKLSQFSRNSTYKTAHFIRRETTARKDDLFVLLSLTNTHFLQHWMAILQSEQALLTGVYALPMLTQLSVRQLKILPPQVLICERLSSGFRQTYLQHGGLRMSRLTPIDPLPSSQLVDCYVTEVEKMHLYLRSQRLVNDELVFQVMLSSSAAEHQGVMERLAQQGFSCRFANWQQAINKLHLKQADVSSCPELHYMQLLNEVGLEANLASAEMTKVYRFKQFANKMYMIAAVVAMIGLSISASLFLQGIHNNEQLIHLTKQTDFLLKQHAFVVRHYPESPISGADLKAVVSTAQMASQQSPVAMLKIISAVLKELPEVSISRIRWVQSSQANIADEAGDHFAEQSNNADGRNHALQQIGFLNVNINQQTGDYQQALASANRLVTNLRADNRVSSVEVITRPNNAQLPASMQGNTSDPLATKPASVTFKLKIILNQIRQEVL